MNSRTLAEGKHFELAIERCCYQLIEEFEDRTEIYLVGIQSGGVQLAERLLQKMTEIDTKLKIHLGKLDITFYRDDFRKTNKPLRAHENVMPFFIENKIVILIDDVLYTGRSVSAAMTALNHYGRPEMIKLLVMVDRRFNRQIPIRADYSGIVVDALDEAYVEVEWKEKQGEDKIILFSHKP